MADQSHDGHHAAQEHQHGTMDVTEQERTFEGFIRFWVLLFGATAVILIFLAIVAT
jgi:uncharacterized membrane protein